MSRVKKKDQNFTLKNHAHNKIETHKKNTQSKIKKIGRYKQPSKIEIQRRKRENEIEISKGNEIRIEEKRSLLFDFFWGRNREGLRR